MANKEKDTRKDPRFPVWHQRNAEEPKPAAKPDKN